MMASDQFEHQGASYVDLKLFEEDVPDVLECCDEWGLTVANTFIDGRLRIWGEPAELHVLRITFS